jgi:hypothetical protein
MGSIFYEIAMAHKAYPDKDFREVKGLYAAGHFPETSHLSIGPVIRKCWKMQFEQASDVLGELEELCIAGKSRKSRYVPFVECSARSDPS